MFYPVSCQATFTPTMVTQCSGLLFKTHFLSLSHTPIQKLLSLSLPLSHKYAFYIALCPYFWARIRRRNVGARDAKYVKRAIDAAIVGVVDADADAQREQLQDAVHSFVRVSFLSLHRHSV